MAELIIDSVDKEEEAKRLLNEAGVTTDDVFEGSSVIWNTFKVDYDRKDLIESVLEENGIEYQWGISEGNEEEEDEGDEEGEEGE